MNLKYETEYAKKCTIDTTDAEISISIYDFVCALSEAIDLVAPVLNNHHIKVAYISYSIAQEMNLPDHEIQEIILASMLHDIGAFPTDERISLTMLKPTDIEMHGHAFLGYELLKGFMPFEKVAVLVKYHHKKYDKSNKEIPLGSYIIHLADRISILIDEKTEILKQVPKISAKIFKRDWIFHPETLRAYNVLAERESFWIETSSSSLSAAKLGALRFPREIIDLKGLRDFAKVVAQLIDFRSRFTATHSSGVAAVAQELTIISGYSERESKLMEIAGFLHDLGKLIVPNEILEKNGALDEEEFNCIRKHTYYTHHILNKIKGLEHIAAWAAYHHERLDGKGYPFHIKGEDFCDLARIMAVADIMTALTEDRPYRAGMDKEKAKNILIDMAENGKIDRNIVEMLNKNFSRINRVRIETQEEARKEYDAFDNAAKEIRKKRATVKQV